MLYTTNYGIGSVCYNQIPRERQKGTMCTRVSFQIYHAKKSSEYCMLSILITFILLPKRSDDWATHWLCGANTQKGLLCTWLKEIAIFFLCLTFTICFANMIPIFCKDFLYFANCYCPLYFKVVLDLPTDKKAIKQVDRYISEKNAQKRTREYYVLNESNTRWWN